MAKYDVSCIRCDSTFEVQLFGPHRDREWQLENRTWLCDECKEIEKREASERAAKAAEEAGLPELGGTEKQVRWAEVLRLAKLKEFDEAQARGVFRPAPGKEAEVAELLASVKGQTGATFWIDNRDNSPLSIMSEFLKAYKPVAEREIEKDAAAEATVRPDKVLSETIAEVRCFDDRVEVHFPERRDDFWSLIKKELHYAWAEKCWVRKIGIFTGAAADRAAETGHRILSAGFPVRIFDDAIRQKAISGEFVRECDRWVSRSAEGPYKDWFSIRWWNGDFYAEAKRLTASRYAKPAIVVPGQHFEEMLDFAQVHGFSLTPGAAALAEEARTAKEAALKVAVKPVEKQARGKAAVRPVLEAPKAVEVPSEFKD
jgi:hypothetical protein